MRTRGTTPYDSFWPQTAPSGCLQREAGLRKIFTDFVVGVNMEKLPTLTATGMAPVGISSKVSRRSFRMDPGLQVSAAKTSHLRPEGSGASGKGGVGGSLAPPSASLHPLRTDRVPDELAQQMRYEVNRLDQENTFSPRHHGCHARLALQVAKTPIFKKFSNPHPSVSGRDGDLSFWEREEGTLGQLCAKFQEPRTNDG